MTLVHLLGLHLLLVYLLGLRLLLVYLLTRPIRLLTRSSGRRATLTGLHLVYLLGLPLRIGLPVAGRRFSSESRLPCMARGRGPMRTAAGPGRGGGPRTLLTRAVLTCG